jgi:hypothetical protein
VSLRLVNPGGPGSGNTAAVYRHRFKGTGRRGGVPVAKGRPYTLSAYMRAEAAGTPVEMVLCNYNFNSRRMDEGTRRTVRLTPAWKRYEITTTFPETGQREGVLGHDRLDVVPVETGLVVQHRGHAAAQADAGSSDCRYRE